ncbi:type II toxin-antitoxin system PemK/MazF family toxin [Globicatella sulfidifaciens]|uniref:Type II toxin-antitoxin system PemK/MazF family toxin n=1 Tax=Globicatella sulfidifaciens TaxID=136093 RepID=A0A7X8C5M1_9LACT|nr:type II toxin-antitoxin system PemK/MazF family toxin [Globicatella sulfidifaciens]NLJ19328.1 type II toxin-antitoxin system PemK/MazF family toxin [Globicatella sulfidifaciens]
MIVEIGEIWLADFAYADEPNVFKERPVVIANVEDNRCLCIGLKVTSRQSRNEYDVELKNWANAGLKKPSYVQIRYYQEFRFSDLKTKIGKLDLSDEMNIWHQLYKLPQIEDIFNL